jgi:hypothetical protein
MLRETDLHLPGRGGKDRPGRLPLPGQAVPDRPRQREAGAQPEAPRRKRDPHNPHAAKDLKPVYTAASEADAIDRFAEFFGKWEKRYPAIIRLWENAWAELVPFLQFDREIRTVICTANAIESINARLCRAVRARGHFPISRPPSRAAGYRPLPSASPCLVPGCHVPLTCFTGNQHPSRSVISAGLGWCAHRRRYGVITVLLRDRR